MQLSSQLEEGVKATQLDLRYASQTIQADLDRFQRQKVADLKDMTLAFSGFHREWCEKVRGAYPRPLKRDLTSCVQNLKQWEAALAEIQSITVEEK